MISNFTNITKERKLTFVFKILFLGLIVFGIDQGYLGQYLPVELWEVVVVFLVASIFFNLVRFFMVTSYRKRSLLSVGQRDNFVLGIDSLSALVVFVITASSLFLIFDIAFRTFLTSISLVAVALVLIFRDYISNYLDSFRLMFTADYRIGDYIKVSEFTKGIITDVSFRATKLKTDEGDVLYIPNTKLMTSEVVNYSKTKFKRIQIPFTLPTNSIKDVATFEKAVTKKLIKAFPELVMEEKIFLRIMDVQNWQTIFQYEVSIDQYNFSVEKELIKKVYEIVLSEHTVAEVPPLVVVNTPAEH